jgi:nucleoside-diphosphate-sugar epimerase
MKGRSAMRVFVTGATGFIGSAVVAELVEAGHEVVGLTRSATGARFLLDVGAKAHRGDLADLKSLHRGAAASDGVIHTAFIHGVRQASLASRLGVILGGRPTGIVARFVKLATQTDRRAVETLGAALEGANRPFVNAFPTMAMMSGHLATEDDAPDPNAPGGARAPSETATLALASRGVRASVVRLPPSVHNETRQGLVRYMIETARASHVSGLVGDGLNRWPAVHVLDAARLFRLALENGAAGARYHAVGEEGLPLKTIAETIGRGLDAPVVEKPASHFGFIAPFVAVDNPASSALTQERLGWRPAHRGLIADIEAGLSTRADK